MARASRAGQLAVEQQQPAPWIRKAAIAVGIAQSASSSGDSSCRRCERLLDEHDRADGEEDVLAEEQADIVGRGGIGLHLSRLVLVELRHAASRPRPAPSARPAGRPSADGRRSSEADRRGDLAEEQIEDQQPAGRRACKPRITAARALLQAVALEQADHRQHDPDDGDDPVVVERLAEGGDDLDRVHAGDAGRSRAPRRSRPASD